MNQKYSNEHTTIIGAGLAGTLLAIRLAQSGFNSQLFERYPHPRDVLVPSGRSINLALAERGRQALDKAGLLAEVDEFTIPMRGRMLHNRHGKTQLQPYSQHESEVIYSVHRDRLNQTLIDAAEQYSGIQLYFDHSLEDIDFNNNVASFRKGSQHSLIQQPFQTLIGCDGAGSRVRELMHQSHPMQVRSDMLDHGYRELTIPSGDSGEPQLDLNALHVWPRGGFMLIALPNADNSFTATLFLAYDGAPGFNQLGKIDDMTEFLEVQFPDVFPLFSNLENDLKARPVGHMGTLYCTPWHLQDKALLLGDAAHAIVPFHGQGMNAAFEDIDLLLDRLTETDQLPDWQSIYADFSNHRHRDTGAIAKMALENYWIMRDAVREPLFHIKKQLEWELENRYPDRFCPRYSMVMFGHLPYAEVRRRGNLQFQIIDQLTTDFDDASALSHIDWQLADKLVKRHLPPF